MRGAGHAKFWAFVALVGFVAACAPAPDAPQPSVEKPTPPKPAKVQLRTTTYEALPGWRDDNHGEALVAFQKSCARVLKRPHDRDMASNPQAPGGTVSQWREPCEMAMSLSPQDLIGARRYFETWFVPYEVLDGAATAGKTTDPREGLFTGYYEPELRGSWQQGGAFQTPLYARPADLVSVNLGQFDDELGGNTVWGRVENGRLRPYPPRTDIENGKVSGLNPILWVDDPVDAFFLHVQGSGRVKMQDGSIVRVGFAGKNGLTYRSIGRVLIDSGEIPADRLTMDAIRQWVHARPVEGPQLLKKNPSFIFFRLLQGDGPIGAQGVALTAERALAIDKRFLPLGAPMWVMTHDPLDATQPFNRLMVAQDTGGAIKGVVRGDIFFGPGAPAAKRAGNMKRPGRYAILLPLAVVPQQTVN